MCDIKNAVILKAVKFQQLHIKSSIPALLRKYVTVSIYYFVVQKKFISTTKTCVKMENGNLKCSKAFLHAYP